MRNVPYVREVKEAMNKFLELFKRQGVARYTGESVLVVSEEVLGVCKRLDAVGALTDDHVLEVLSGLCICTNAKFRGMFTHLKQSAELKMDNLSVLDNVSEGASNMEQIEGIIEKAIDTYDILCTAQIWNKTTKGGPSALKSIVNAVRRCWNCEEEGCSLEKCPKPRNPAVIAKNKKAFYKNKRKQVSSSGNDNGGNDNGSEIDNGGNCVDKSHPDYQRKIWEANLCKMMNGVLHVKCNHCGYNLSHHTKYHGQ